MSPTCTLTGSLCCLRVGSQVRMQSGDQAEAAAKVLARDTTKTRESHGALPPTASQPRAASVKVDLAWR